MNDSLMSEAVDERVVVAQSTERSVALTRPDLIEVKGQAWFTHPSFSQNPKSSFEVEDGLLFDDYERLEVSLLARAEYMRSPESAQLSLISDQIGYV